MNKKIITGIIALVLAIITIKAAVAFEVTSTPLTTATLNAQYQYQVNTTGAAGQIQYSLVSAPSGMQISNTGLVTWIPTQTGSYFVNISITDTGVRENVRSGLTEYFPNTIYQAYTITVSQVQSQFSAGNTELGSSTQIRGETTQTVWKIRNTGSNSITNINIQTSGINSKYNFAATLPSTTLGPQQEMDIVVSALVPLDQNAGRSRIGQITINGNSGGNSISLARDVTLEAENNLIIRRVDVRVDGRRSTLTSPGTVDRKAKLGSEIEIKVEVRNTFADSSMRIEDIDVELISDDIPDADGLDKRISTLRGGNSDDVTFTFTLDDEDIEPSDSPFTITIEVTGEDRNRATHGETWDIRLELDRSTRDIRILDVRANPSVLSCTARNIRVDTRIRNIGARDLDRAMIRYRMDDFNIDLFRRDIELDESDTREFSQTIQLPLSVRPGEYILEVDTYTTTSTSSSTDTKTLIIQVLPCEDIAPTRNETTKEPEKVITPPVITGNVVSSGTGKRAFGFDSEAYMYVLGILVVILLIVVVLMLFRMTK